VTVLAAIRPDSVNLPLLLHVLGAMLLVGDLLAIGIVTVLGLRDRARAAGLSRFVFLGLLLGVLPSYILMRVGAQWTEAEQDYPEEFDPAWLGIGYVTADLGALLILVSAVVAGIGLRRRSVALSRFVGVVSLLLLAAYLVAIWAMSAKPV
jgi:hypothetical protein